MSEGAWIFLSHSHQDFDRVSGVRDFLEARRHHPLMFFLKCLNDDHEIDDLIRREIEARSWFILCNSNNARKSKWVQDEVQIIRGLQATSHTYTEIDLDDPRLDLESALFTFTRRASVFLSFAQPDRAFAAKISVALREQDFGVFSDLELKPGEAWQARIESELENAARDGAVLLLLSAESVRSDWQQREVAFAVRLASAHAQQTHIVPLFLEGFGVLETAPHDLRQQLMEQGLDFSIGEFQENMARLMTALRKFMWRA
jgi:hypothetical protein